VLAHGPRQVSSQLKSTLYGLEIVVLIRGTKKCLSELGVSEEQLAEEDGSASACAEWYGNLIRFERRKCLVFTDVETLFTFFVPGVTKKNYRDFRGLFLGSLQSALAVYNLDVPDYVMDDDIRFGRTRDRRVLGSMNDLIFMLTHCLAFNGGLSGISVADVVRQVNETPMQLIKDSPDRAIRSSLGQPYN